MFQSLTIKKCVVKKYLSIEKENKISAALNENQLKKFIFDLKINVDINEINYSIMPLLNS